MPFTPSPEVAAALAEGKPIVALESTIISHGLPRPQNLEVAREVEDIVRDHGAVPATIAVANPVKHEMDRKRHDAILKSGLAGARKAGIIGKAVTPFLLEHFHTASEGESLSVNIEIIKSNSALAADIAVAKQHH